MMPQNTHTFILGTAMSLMMLGCNQQSNSEKTERFSFFKRNKGDSAHGEVTSTQIEKLGDKPKVLEVDQEFARTSQQILKLLETKNLKGLSKYIHPDKGVIFSPYAFLDSCRKLSAKQLLQESASDSVNLWGYYDGSGDSILMTFAEYYEAFVYCADFMNSADTSINQSKHAGNSLNNFHDRFPNAQYIDFYVAGTEEYGFLDWRTLRMGFEKKGRKWYLIALIHDEWTI